MDAMHMHGSNLLQTSTAPHDCGINKSERPEETRGGGSQDPFLATFALLFARTGLCLSAKLDASTDSSAHVGITARGSPESSVQVSVWDPLPQWATVNHSPTRSEKFALTS